MKKLILTIAIMLLMALNLFAQKTADKNEEFSAYWDDLITSMGNNAKGNTNPKDVAKGVNFPLLLELNGKITKVEKKEFIKKYDDILDISYDISYMELSKFIEVDNLNDLKDLPPIFEKPYYKVKVTNMDNVFKNRIAFFAKIKGKFKLIYLIKI